MLAYKRVKVISDMMLATGNSAEHLLLSISIVRTAHLFDRYFDMDSTSHDGSLSHQTTRLPLELVLMILELAARTWRDIHPHWSASLQLVCHAVQNALEPIIYGLFTVEMVQTYHNGASQKALEPDAQRLEQILANDAPKVCHLILGQHSLARFKARTSIPIRTVPRLSIIAGNRDRTSHLDLTRIPLIVCSDDTELLFYGQLEYSILEVSNELPWTRGRFWDSEDNPISYTPHYDFLVTGAPDAGYNLSALTPRGERWFFLELADLRTTILYDIANILRSLQPELQNAHVVLACAPEYMTRWGIGVDEAIQLLDASRTLPPEDLTLEAVWCRHQRPTVQLDSGDFRILRKSRVSPELLYSRLHISDALWQCDELERVGMWYGRAIERGDAWDEGRLVRRFVP